MQNLANAQTLSHTHSFRYIPSLSIRIILLFLFLYVLIMPLGSLFSLAFEVDILRTIMSRSFLKTLKQTLYVGITASLISLFIATILAWAMVRTQMHHKKIFNILLVLPMLIPSISHGIGLVLLFGTNGIITNFFGLDLNIYGFKGIVIGSVMYTFPIAFLMISDILKYEDKSAYEAAQVLGISAKDRFLCLTIPYMRKPLISVVFTVFALVITDYGVPLITGGKYRTLAVVMYQDVIGMLDFSKGAIISLFFIIPPIMALILDLTNKDKASMHFVHKPFNNRKRPILDKIAYFFCSLVSVFVVLPICSFVLLSLIKGYPREVSFSLEHILSVIQVGGLSFLYNSLLIAFVVSCIGTFVAIIIAYVTVRSTLKYRKIFHFLAIISLAIPGLVLGLAYILFFKSSIIYGTFAILILVNMIHFFAPSYLMMYNVFHKINKDLESVAFTLGLQKWNIIIDVILPQAKRSILECFTYFFIMSMVTISAVSFLANFATKPLSLMINSFQTQMLFEASAVVSLIIFLINLTVKLLQKLYKID